MIRRVEVVEAILGEPAQPIELGKHLVDDAEALGELPALSTLSALITRFSSAEDPLPDATSLRPDDLARAAL